jgi:hypothetical protein
MKEVLSFFTFGIGALCFVAFFTALKPLAVTAATGLANPAYCSTKASPALACQSHLFAAVSSPHVGQRQ